MFKIFIGNLDKRTTVEQVKMLLASFPDLEDLVLATDDDGKSRGFAIAMFRDPERGKEAIAALSQRRINGRELVVNEALSKKDRKKFLAEKAKQDAERQRGFGPRGPGGMSARPSNRPFNRNPRRGGGFVDDRRGYGDGGGQSGPSYGSPRQFGGHGGGHGGFGSRGGAPSGPPGTGRIGGVGLGGSRPLGGAAPGSPRPPMGMPPARPPMGAPHSAPGSAAPGPTSPAPSPRPLTFGPGRPTTPPSAIPLAAPRSPLAPRAVPPAAATPAAPPSSAAAPPVRSVPSAGSVPHAAPAANATPLSAAPAAAPAPAAASAPAAADNAPAKSTVKSASKSAPKSSSKSAAKSPGKSASKPEAKASGADDAPKAKAAKPAATRRKKSADGE